MPKLLFVFGTRPEAVKLCPVLLHFRREMQNFGVKVCVTAQHRSMLDQVLAVFKVKPDHDLDVMQPAQTLAQSTARMIAALEPVMKSEQPDMVVVQGDTTTSPIPAVFRRKPLRSASPSLYFVTKPSGQRPWRPLRQRWWRRIPAGSSPRQKYCWMTPRNTHAARAFTILTAMAVPASGLARQSVHSSKQRAASQVRASICLMI